MLRDLTIVDFKSFVEADLPIAPFTLLIGANAGGKSNVREALRVLHGIARGYSLAEVLGEKWGRGGDLEWTGIRGGAGQAVRRGQSVFSLRVDFDVTVASPTKTVEGSYEIAVEIRDGGIPSLSLERLSVGRYGFDTHPDGVPRPGAGERTISARLRRGTKGFPPDETFIRDRPILRQLDDTDLPTGMRRHVDAVIELLQSMRFLDLDPDLARRSSARGVATLGDRGQNLSSVLSAIAESPETLEAVSGWIRALTPMDAVGIDFITDLNNQTLAVLVEDDGQRTPLSSASDGTVRFLAIVALLFAPQPPSVIFLEEIENGIHPHRVALLLDLLEQRVAAGGTQIVATSHSPQLFEASWGMDEARPILVTRVSGRGSTALDLKCEPSIVDIVEAQGPAGSAAELMSDGWFEDVADFIASDGGGQ